jgi:hypothetical protein
MQLLRLFELHPLWLCASQRGLRVALSGADRMKRRCAGPGQRHEGGTPALAEPDRDVAAIVHLYSETGL